MAGEIYGRGFLELAPRLDSGGLRNVERSLGSRLGGAAKTIGKTVGAVLATGIAGGIAVGGFAIKGGIGRALDTENAIVQMRRLGLETAEIDKIVSDVDKTFDGTVFSNPEGFALTQRLIGAGESLDSIPDRLRTISDFAAHGNVPLDRMGEIFERILSQGRVTGRELNRLSEANIPLGALAESLGLTVPELRKMTSEGKLTSEMFLDAANNADMFQGAAKAAGDTTTGAFKNTVTQLKVLGEQLVKPLFGEGGPLVTLFQASRQALIDVRPMFKSAGEAIGNFLVPRIDRLADWLQDGGIPRMIENFGDKWVKVRPHLQKAGEFLRGVVDRLKELFDNGDGASGIMDTLKENTKGLQGGLVLMAGPLMLIARELFPLIKPLLEAIVPPLAEMANQLAPALADALQWLVDNVLPGLIDMIEGLIGWVTDNKGLVVAFGIAVIAFQAMTAIMALNPFVLLIAAVVGIAALIITNWDNIVDFLKRAWDRIKTAASTIWENIKTVFRKAVDFLKDLFFKFTPLGIIISKFDKIKEVATGAADWIKDKFNAVVDFFKKMPGRISSAVSGLWDGLKNAFKNAVNWIIDRWNAIKFTIPKIDTPFGTIGGGSFGVPQIPRLHDGGMVPGRPGQEMLAILEAGERVLSRAEVAAGEGGRTRDVLVTVNEKVEPYQVGAAVSWALRTAGV